MPADLKNSDLISLPCRARIVLVFHDINNKSITTMVERHLYKEIKGKYNQNLG